MFLNDGKYGSYSGVCQDFQTFNFIAHSNTHELTDNLIEWTISGPTCDSTDIVANNYYLPDNIELGDFIISHDVGAYNAAFACKLIGFNSENTILI